MELKQFKLQCKKCYYCKNNFCGRFGKEVKELCGTVVTDKDKKICIGFLEGKFARMFIEHCQTCAHLDTREHPYHGQNCFCFSYEDFVEDKARQKVKCDRYIENVESNIINKGW